MSYIPLKKRIYDLVHAREYIPEIEKWDPRAKREFGRIRYVLKCYDEKKDPLAKLEGPEVRSFQRAIKAELGMLQQYCRKKDYEDREKKRKRVELAKKKSKVQLQSIGHGVTVKQMIASLTEKVDSLTQAVEELQKCVKANSKSSSKKSN